ncbi:amylo-alpha-1,6-glucosidase [Mumia sp. DW29H23]|uniref:amylo-alpha-1,6-glucosidase n=1 Tax=Mumia sp. DW29H23 TaxID=3421241 RepID=UPI003D690C99
MNAWASGNEPAGGVDGSVTLLEGSSFCISSVTGDLGGPGPTGLFFRDMRILSRWELTIDGERPQPLAALTPEPYRGRFVARLPRRGRTDTNVLVHRERHVANGIRETVTIQNPAPETVACTVVIEAAADFADLFDVKDGRVDGGGEHRSEAGDARLVLVHRGAGADRAAVVDAPGASVTSRTSAAGGAGTLTYEAVVPARGEWTASLLVHPVVEGEDVETSFPFDRAVSESLPAVRLQRWQSTTPIATTGHVGLQRVLHRSQEDLGALRIFERGEPSEAAVAAGAPWFMALFGRDSLLTAYMALPVDRSLALGTLRKLARHQGRRTVPVTEEEPGKILHEVRLGTEASLALGGGSTYYGTVDATPLFVVVLGEVARWGASPEEVQALLPAADRALEWIDRHGDRDGDGFVEYERATDRGLRNQGWKDSWDGVTFADGRPAEPAIALCEVQGYAYQAFVSRAHLAADAGDPETAERWRERAATLKRAFNERFWLPERGWFALALDRDKEPVDACASNMGHCLWSGIVDDELAPAVAEHLMSPEMFTGWGVRTLSSAMGAYDPVSYHNGSVWPHDNALVAAGLMRYGFVDEATRLAEGMLTAAERFGGRLPELFCGFDRDEYEDPVPYPTSCSPQAWAAAAPVQIVRSLLRFDPWLPRGELWVDPVLPAAYRPLRVQGVGLGDARTTLTIDGDESCALDGLPAGVDVHREPWPAAAP